MKTMFAFGYYHNGFVATHALGCHKAIVVITGRKSTLFSW